MIRRVHAWRRRYFRSDILPLRLLSALILIVTCLFVRWINALNAKSLLQVGALWVVMTIAFEFTFGHYIFNRSWADLVSDYDLARGGFLAIGMLVVMFSPVIAAKLRIRNHHING
jgi:hypothetical protein